MHYTSGSAKRFPKNVDKGIPEMLQLMSAADAEHGGNVFPGGLDGKDQLAGHFPAVLTHGVRQAGRGGADAQPVNTSSIAGRFL